MRGKILGALFVAVTFIISLGFVSCKTEAESEPVQTEGAFGSLTFSPAVGQSAARSLYTDGIKSAIVTVKGYSSSGELFSKSSGVVAVQDGTANGITVTQIPVCSNAVVSVQAYSNVEGTSAVSGVHISALTDILPSENTVSVNWNSTKEGNVFLSLIDSGVNTNTLGAENAALIKNSIPSSTHASLINASAIASDYKSNSLKAASNYVLQPGTLNVTCNEYDGCTLLVTDPISSRTTASTSAPVSITNIAPGTWTLYVLDGNVIQTSKTVTVSSGGTVNVSIGTAVINDRIIVHVAEVSNSTYNPAQYSHIWVWSGSTNYCTNPSWPGDALSDSDSDGWYDYTIMNGSSYVTSSMIILSKNKNPQTENLSIPAAGEYWWNGSSFVTENPNPPAEPTPPVISFSRTSGSSLSLAGLLNISLSDGGEEITSAEVTLSGAVNASFAYQDFTDNSLSIDLSLYSLSAGESFSVSVSATNSLGTSIKSASYTTKEADAIVSDPNELRIYQVMVSSFQDGDSSIGYTQMWGPDGALKGGDLQGIIDSVVYIKDLGCNALWMTPIFQSNTGYEKLKATGYFANDYFNIDSHFGTNEKFAELVSVFHDNGIAVILDGVFGHNAGTSLVPSPNRSGIQNPGITPSTSNPVDYAGNGNSLKYYSDVARYWITEYKIDGWRFDQCYQVGLGDKSNSDNTGAGGHNYWYDIRKVIEEAAASNGTKGSDWGTLGYLVGEHWNGDATRIQAGSVASGTAAGYGLNGCFDFPAYYAVVQGFACEYGNASKTTNNITSGLSYLYKTYSEKGYVCLDDDGAYDIYYPNFMLTNHDLYRIGDVIKGKWGCAYDSDEYIGRNKVLIAAQCAYTGPITIYYGDEIGDHSVDLSGWGGDNVARSSGKITGFNSREQTIHDWTKKCLEVRSEHKALWSGTNEQVIGESDFYVAKKAYENERVFIAFNYSTSSSKQFSATGTDLLSGSHYAGTVTVPALSAVFVLED